MALKFLGAEPVKQSTVQTIYSTSLASNPNAKVLRFAGAEPIDAKRFKVLMAASYTVKTKGFFGAEPVDLKAAKVIVNP